LESSDKFWNMNVIPRWIIKQRGSGTQLKNYKVYTAKNAGHIVHVNENDNEQESLLLTNAVPTISSLWLVLWYTGRQTQQSYYCSGSVGSLLWTATAAGAARAAFSYIGNGWKELYFQFQESFTNTKTVQNFKLIWQRVPDCRPSAIKSLTVVHAKSAATNSETIPVSTRRRGAASEAGIRWSTTVSLKAKTSRDREAGRTGHCTNNKEYLRDKRLKRTGILTYQSITISHYMAWHFEFKHCTFVHVLVLIILANFVFWPIARFVPSLSGHFQTGYASRQPVPS